MDFTDGDYGLNTMLAHFGEDEKIKGAVVPPLFQNSLFVFETQQELMDAMLNKPGGPPYHYSRLGNPTVDLAQRKIAALEGAEACLLLATGMGAISVVLMSTLKTGSHAVVVDTCYGPVKSILNDYFKDYGVTATFVEGSCPEDIIDAIRPETTLVYLESPSSMFFRLQDLEAITKVCRERGITTAIDNTYSTPLYQKPIAMGVDIVIHSGTKYFGGHSDITAGVVCSTRERIDTMIKRELAFLGSILAPFPAWLLTRGLRTLNLRLRQHEINANIVASWLDDQPTVDRVHHLGLPSYPQRDLFLKQMKGSTGLFSFEPKVQDDEKIRVFVESLNIFQLGISWGGFESLVVPLKLQPAHYTEPRWVIRLFVGLEDPEDLIADLTQAMAKAGF